MAHIDDVITYTYAVTSTGNLAPAVDKATGLVDDKCAPVTYVSGDANNDGKVDSAETWAFTCQYKVKPGDVNAESQVINTAVVTGKVQWMSDGKSSVARASTSSECSKSSRVRMSTGSSCGGGGCPSSDSAHKSTSGSCGGGCPSSSSARKSTSGSDSCGGGCPSSSSARKSTSGSDGCGGCPKSSRAQKSTGSDGCGGGCPSSDSAHKSTGSDGCGGTPCPDAKSSKARKSTSGGSKGDGCPEVKTATVTATAKWTTLIVFPGIDVTKSATQSRVTQGGTIDYTIKVKNTGTVDLTVTPQDVGCTMADGSPFDTTPFALAIGATKTLTCKHVTVAADGSLYHNEACATGMDAAHGTTKDCDHTDTPIDPPTTTTSNPPPGGTPPGQQVAGQQTPPTTPGQVVLGTRVAAGTARLLGPTGCTAKAFNARIRGTQIARVTFVLDGKTIKRLTKPNLKGAFAVRINPKSMRLGVHRLVANITFKSASATKAKRLRLSFQRCAKALTQPRFTG
jgi:hypothetical protein